MTTAPRIEAAAAQCDGPSPESPSAPASTSRVVVVILMYRGAEQAIECVSSVLASRHGDFRIVLLDNSSPDGALDRVRQWARGEMNAMPIGATPVGAEHATCGPIDHGERAANDAPDEIASLPLLTLVPTGANLGYAGGNNVALKWLRHCRDWDYAWILNPDTVVDPAALPALVRRSSADPALGPVGARVCFYDRPNTVQQWGGGRFCRWRASARLLGSERAADELVDERSVECALDYVTGASLFFSRDFLDRTGLMDERYFLYYEEIDWCRSGAMPLGYAHDAVVYHRLGGSIGSSMTHRKASPLSIRCMYRSRLLFTRKFFPWRLPTVYLGTYLDIARMIQRGAWRNAWLVFKTINGLERITAENLATAKPVEPVVSRP